MDDALAAWNRSNAGRPLLALLLALSPLCQPLAQDGDARLHRASENQVAPSLKPTLKLQPSSVELRAVPPPQSIEETVTGTVQGREATTADNSPVARKVLKSAPASWGSGKVNQGTSAAKPKPHIRARYSTQGIKGTDRGDKVRVYQSVKANGVTVFSDKAPAGANYRILLFDCFACQADSLIDWRSTPLFRRAYGDWIREAARKHQLEPALIRAVIHAESAFNPRAISRTGAMGLMQLMPQTARELGVGNALEARQNIFGGSQYLAQMLKRFDGDLPLAFAAYNAGPTLVAQLGKIPPYPETRAYVERVQILLKRYRKQGA
jgi:soluble lytic murein transglycosylase-like protein